jgi:sigma-B regulation protein RsbU (phosphoserine phosphatase)
MSNLQATVRLVAGETLEPARFCERLNQVVSANKVPGKFITFFYCVVDSELGRVRFTNAGHNWPILAHADGALERLTTADTVLGMDAASAFHEQELDLRGGDRLVLFTDGITEACAPDGEEFGEERLAKLSAAHVALSPSQMKDTLLAAVEEHSRGSFADDATLIVIGIE